jgi:NAD(P)-dependent dehydrogenase (short-subunit alcohol dehydrogenase family)
MRLQGRVALVTGGASGIGSAVVKAFLRERASVVFIDVNKERGQALADEFHDSGDCQFFHGDVSLERDCIAAVSLAEKSYGCISILVNNAASFLSRSIEASTMEWELVLRTNIIGPSLLTRSSLDSMKKAGGGAIVNLSSISAFIAQAGTMTYNTTKAAILGMTRCMALDLAPFNIRANCVCPGYTRTPAFFDYLESSGRPTEEVEKTLSAQTMLNRIGTPEEVAACVLFLSSPESSYVTGTFLLVDGGLTSL